MTSRKKFKIQKKVKEHSKKLQKLSKGLSFTFNPIKTIKILKNQKFSFLQKSEVFPESTTRKHAEKPISVPNKCPFKEELLIEAEKKREERKEEQAAKKAQQKAAKREKPGQKRKATVDSIETLAKKAAQDEVWNNF